MVCVLSEIWRQGGLLPSVLSVFRCSVLRVAGLNQQIGVTVLPFFAKVRVPELGPMPPKHLWHILCSLYLRQCATFRYDMPCSSDMMQDQYASPTPQF